MYVLFLIFGKIKGLNYLYTKKKLTNCAENAIITLVTFTGRSVGDCIYMF